MQRAWDEDVIPVRRPRQRSDLALMAQAIWPLPQYDGSRAGTEEHCKLSSE